MTKQESTLIKWGCLIFAVVIAVVTFVIIITLISSLRGTQLTAQEGGGTTGGLCSEVPPKYQEIFFTNTRGQIPPALLAALFYREHGYVTSYKSGYTPTNQRNDKWPEKDGDPTAITGWQNGKGSTAKGPFQILDGTWAGYGSGDVQNINDASLAAAKYSLANYKNASGEGDERLQRTIYMYNQGNDRDYDPNSKSDGNTYAKEVWALYKKFSCDNTANPTLAGRMDVPFIPQAAKGWCSRSSQAMTIAYFDKANLSKYSDRSFQQSHMLIDSTIASFTHKNYHYGNPSLDAVINSISKGYPAIVYTNYYDQHIFVLTGYDPATETFWANDTFPSANGGHPKDTQKIDGEVLTKGNLQSHLKAQNRHTFITVP